MLVHTILHSLITQTLDITITCIRSVYVLPDNEHWILLMQKELIKEKKWA